MAQVFNKAYWCSIISVTFLFFALASASAQTRIAPRNVEQQAFRDGLREDLADRVKGYAFVLADRNGIVATASGGWAQAPGDGQVPMKTYVPANVGSIAKVASGIALLDLLEANLAPGQSVDQKLDTPIRFYVPDKWVQAYFRDRPNDPINRITLRLLLNHRSGLKDVDDGGAHGTKVARALADGPNQLLIGRGPVAYLNENISLLLYIIPRIAYPTEVDAIERRNAGKSLRDYNVTVAREYGSLYERYMRERFFPRTLEPIAPTCRPGEDVPNARYAKEYDSKDDTRGRTDNSDFCRSQGSWYYSAQELAQLARTIEFSSKFINASTRNLLLPNGFPNKRLVYWRLLSHQLLALDSGGRGSYRAHGGKAPLGSRAILIKLPFGYVGVGIANSPELNSSKLGTALMNAFYDATRNWTEWNTDRPGMDLKNMFLIRPDPELCRAECNKILNCQSWTYVKPGIQHGAAAKCWLKSGIPAARTSACCNSGIKDVNYDSDRPGSDYRNFAVGRNDAALCRAACGLDPKCKAWTFVKPGAQGEGPRCWLKNRAPRRKNSKCCASGLSPR